MKNVVFWDVAPCRYCVNRCFGGTYRLHLQSIKIRERGTSVSRWLQTQILRIFLFYVTKIVDVIQLKLVMYRLSYQQNIKIFLIF
jgi:hypothetical protein